MAFNDPADSMDIVSSSRPFSFPGTGAFSETRPQTQSQQQQQCRPVTSRFVEGSMNDRSSRAPPVSYFGSEPTQTRDSQGDRDDRDDRHSHSFITRRSLQMARPSLSTFRTSNTTASSGTTASIATTNTVTSSASGSTALSGTLRRPRSFLAPFWDGVTRRLHRRTRSTVEADMEKRRQELQEDQQRQQCQQQQQQQQQQQEQCGILLTPEAPLPPPADRPSPDDVFANYQQLMQAGFFNKRAIPATRQGLTGGHAVTSAPTSNPSLSARPDRFAPPPPKPAFLSSGTPLSPVAPSPTTSPMTTTPRGTKRVRADVDNDGQEDETHALRSAVASFANADITAASSPTRSPRKLSKKLRKSSSRLPGGESLRSAAANEAYSSRPSTAHSTSSFSSRSTRSSQMHAPVDVHQTLPPLPGAMHTLKSDCEATAVVSKKHKETGVTIQKQQPARREHHPEHRHADSNTTVVDDQSQEPRRKRRSYGTSAVVHQSSQASNASNGSNAKVCDEERSQGEQRPAEPLHTSLATRYHEPLGPLNPVVANRGGSNSRRAPRSNVSSSIVAVSSAPTPLDPQQPISFHYPQRVRVRRPMQAQIVEVKASSAPLGRTRSNTAANEGQRKLEGLGNHGKPLLFRDEDIENQAPVYR